jgi:hypothetical protein
MQHLKQSYNPTMASTGRVLEVVEFGFWFDAHQPDGEMVDWVWLENAKAT